MPIYIVIYSVEQKSSQNQKQFLTLLTLRIFVVLSVYSALSTPLCILCPFPQFILKKYIIAEFKQKNNFINIFYPTVN